MEAITESVSSPQPGQVAQPVLARVLTLLRGLGSTVIADSALLDLHGAADFAGELEELSRIVGYLQLVAAKAVDRSRNQESPAAGNGGSAAGWVTGWDSAIAGNGGELAATGWNSDEGLRTVAGMVPGPVDDGFRNTAEFLRGRLRISAAEARRRLSLAGSVLPRPGLAGQLLPPEREELALALASGNIASRAGSIITLALDRVRHTCDAEALGRMEHALTRTAAENDPDFLARVARRWTDALDQDGAEPSEEELHRLQGAFIRRSRHGLHHLEVFATGDQFEQLLIVMNTAANPRAASPAGAGGQSAGCGTGSASAGTGECDGEAPDAEILDRRSRPQKLLDGLIDACKAALAFGVLPATGGLRPQVLATIDYRDLLAELEASGTVRGTQDVAGTRTTAGRQTGGGPDRRGHGHGHGGTLLFTGPITASTIRKIACDADIIPVLLGAEGRILDIGRASRLFPPHLRKAITARDQGCAFPSCTIPAPWCEAHHITYWSHGGTTGTDNGTLLCSHHHHLIHKEQWTIQIRTGIPWFIPPPHLDPHRKPRQNHYFRT